MPTDSTRLQRILRLLERAYPEAQTELRHRNCFELLIATILSAQCTDERVNRVTPVLFDRYPTPERLAGAGPKQVEELIRSTGFFRAKTRSIIGCSQEIVKRFGGAVPRTLEELVTLPGVWRKTANVILGNCYQIPSIVVDTHVKRVSRRLGLAKKEDPDGIEAELAAILPKTSWTKVSHRLLLHGRYLCKARYPLCEQCPLLEVCEAPEKDRVLKARAQKGRR